MKNELVNLVNISKSYDSQLILDDLNLYIRENEFLTLLGPSGCGKTTTLRILGGFEKPDKGQVIFNGQDITKLPPNKRQSEYGISEVCPFYPYGYRGKYCLRIKNQK